jgi:riboflavin synthase
MGGHLVQGHVDGTGVIESINQQDEATSIQIRAPSWIMRYVVEKGFIAVDGVSLTVTSRDDNGFTVAIVKFTWANTHLSRLVSGKSVNLEVDIIAKYVENFTFQQKNAIDNKFLKEHGFF